MKIQLNEKQIKNLFKNIKSTPEISEDDSSSSDGSSTSYPEVSKWEDDITRGPANQIDDKSTWDDVVGSTLQRGKANQLK